MDQSVTFAAQYFCDQPKAGAYELTVKESVDAVLAAGAAGQVYAAMKHGPKFHLNEFFRLARGARDPAALALIRRRFVELDWAETVLALDGTELVPELLEGVHARRTFNDSAPPLAAGYFGGIAVKPQLRALFDTMTFRPDRFALGIAIIGDPADLAFFKALSTIAENQTAKRIHGALAKEKLKDRLAAVDALTKNVDSVAPLIALCKLISDDNAEIVEHAAVALRDYAIPREASDAFHLIFLNRARAAIARGVTRNARIALDEMQKHIPRSEPFPAGPDVAAVAPRKVKGATLGAKARGLEMLETMREQLPVKPATQRDAALEAEIAVDPDDPARYLVYADWLQQQNDARGFLILLHHAMHQQPGDKARAVAAQGFLDQHRYALLGRLEPFVRERDLATIELEWFMGFIRKARIASQSAKLIVDGLAYLLENPSAIFLQELEIDSQGGPLRIAPQVIVDMLLEAKRPETLRMITIGKPGSWEVPPELPVVFPRMQRDPVMLWNDVVAKIAEQRRIKHGVELVAIPPLKTPYAIKPDIDAILVGLKCELELDRPLGLLAAMPRIFDADSLDELAVALLRRWELQSQNPRWLFDIAGPLGGERCVRWLGEHLRTFSHQRAVQAIEHLTRIGSDVAVNQLISLLFDGGGARQYATSSALDVIAKRRKLADRDELLVTACPDTADEPTQRRWLEHVMMSGYRIPSELFRRHVIGNRVRAALARTLLWAECKGERIVRLLAGDEPRGRVGLVHPAELSADELAAARREFPAQSIRQLDRPVFSLSQKEAATTGIVKFASRRVGFYALQGAFEGRGWTPINDDDLHGLTSGWSRWFERDHVRAQALLASGNGAISELRLFGTDGQPRRFSDMHVVTLSELLWDVEAAHGWTQGAPEPRGPAGVVVERAKSGRSKCVICTEPIAKDAVRVGVERLIETPAFTGRATVWLHPDCAAKAPELAGVDIAKLVAIPET